MKIKNRQMLVQTYVTLVFLLGLGGGAIGVPVVAGAPAPVTKAGVSEIYRKSPLGFEMYQGQTPAQGSFVSRGSGYTIMLSPAEAMLTLQSAKPSGTNSPKSESLRMKLVASNPGSKAVAVEPLPGKANYFIGNDPDKWRINVPRYAKVKYENVYRGVDLVYYGNQRQLEFDFIVAPGANPETIALKFEGAKNLDVDSQGNLVINTGSGQILEHKPLIYQDVDGARKEIAGGFVLQNNHEVNFQIAAYDQTKALVIDPMLSYSTYLGGSGADFAFGIAVDAAGYAYVVGETASMDFPTNNDALEAQSHVGANVSVDGFVTKFSPTGTLLFSTYLGGTNYGGAVAGVALGPKGNIFLTGDTGASDFPTTPGAFQTTYNGFGQDAFIAKLDATGTKLLYSTFLGGNNQDDGSAIAVDGTGCAIVTGRTQSSNFPVKNAYQPNYRGGPQFGDAFVTKINQTGTKLVYSTYLGGTGDEGYTYNTPSAQIAVDADGNTYVTGTTSSTDFPSVNAFQPANGGTASGDTRELDAYLTKFDPNGRLVFSTYLGGNALEFGNAVAVDSRGDVYVAGYTASCDFPFQFVAGPARPDSQPGAFVVKFKVSGRRPVLVYATCLPNAQANGITVDATRHAYITGFAFIDFPTYDAFQPALASAATDGSISDAFVAELAPDGASFVYSTYLGGTNSDVGSGVGIDAEGNAYVAGYTASTNFPTVNAYQPGFQGGGFDAFVTKIAPNCATFGPWVPCTKP